MTLLRNLSASFIVLLLGLSLVAQVSAQQPTPSDDQVNAIAHQLYCPVCENIPLDVCRTPACAQWRELIRQKLSAGWTDQQIKNYFVEQYGARVLGTPPAKGINWLVYVVPPLAILGGVYILFRVFRFWKQPPQAADVTPPAEPAEPAPAQDDYIRRLEDEVRNR